MALALPYACLIASALGVALLIRRYDLHQREPIWTMILACIFGSLTFIPIVGLDAWPGLGTRVLMTLGTGTLPSALVAGVSEEAAKAGVVLLIALTLPRRFNEPLDGLIYGSLAGLGFAVAESISILGSDATAIMMGHEIIRLFGHAIMGGISGFGIGLRATPTRRGVWIPAALASLALAICLHFAWDVLAFTILDDPGMTRRALYMILAPAVMLLGLVAFGSLVRIGSHLSVPGPTLSAGAAP